MSDAILRCWLIVCGWTWGEQGGGEHGEGEGGGGSRPDLSQMAEGYNLAISEGDQSYELFNPFAGMMSLENGQ